jgi:hypothetical protein
MSSLTKPGANTIQLVGTQEKGLKCIGKSDIIVINRGTNDIGNGNFKENCNCNYN